jgi:hypothetical protein
VLQPFQSPTQDSSQTDEDQRRQQVRRRQLLTVIFAIALLLVAGTASAQAPTTNIPMIPSASLQYDGVSPLPTAHRSAASDAAQLSGGAIGKHRQQANSRPAYAQLQATLANFDSDAQPDGWRVEITLRDRQDRPLAVRARATIELMPRVPMADHIRYVDADTAPIRWSMPLEFDQDSVARMKLPLRRSLRPMLGWPSAIDPPARHRGRNPFGRKRTFVTTDLRNLIGTPNVGEMRVRVAVPTEGVFEAVTLVPIRPSVLVDTNWPYR